MQLLPIVLILLIQPIMAQIPVRALGSENYALCNMYLFGSKVFKVANAVGTYEQNETENSIAFCIVQPFIQSEFKQLDFAVFKHFKYLNSGLYAKYINVYNVSQLTIGNGYQFKTHPKVSIGLQMEASYFHVQNWESIFNIAFKFSGIYYSSEKLKSSILFNIPTSKNYNELLFCSALQYTISQKITGIAEFELDHQFDRIIKLGIVSQLNKEWKIYNGFSLQRQLIGFGLKRSLKNFQYVMGINYHQNLGTGCSIDVQYVW